MIYGLTSSSHPEDDDDRDSHSVISDRQTGVHPSPAESMAHVSRVLEQMSVTLQASNSRQHSVSVQLHALGDQQLHLSESMEGVYHRVSSMENGNSPAGQDLDLGDASHILGISSTAPRSSAYPPAAHSPYGDRMQIR